MVSLFTFIFCGVMAQASKVSYPEQKLRALGVEKLQISGVKGHVKLTGRPGKTYRLKVRHSKGKKWQDWSLSVDRQGSTLVFEVSSAAYGKQWRAHVRKELWPEFDVSIEGPAIPVSVSWREGDLEFSNWAAPVEASQVKGRVSVKDGGGNYTLLLGASDVTVDGLAGDLRLKGDHGRVRIVKLTGQLTVHWVSGDMEIKKTVGDGKIESTTGKLRLSACKGDWDIHLSRGHVDIDSCSGNLKAEGDSAEWRLSKSPLSEVEIKSLSGPVRWDWKEGGAKVFLTTDKGQISGLKIPSILDRDGRKVSEVTLGSKPFAQVFVRTQSGAIHFQQ